MKAIRFDNRVLRRLPVDPEKQNFVREVKNACFALLKPTPVKNPALVAVSPSALALLGLPVSITAQVAEASPAMAVAAAQVLEPKATDGEDVNATLVEEMAADLTRFLSGNELMEGSEPAAHCYCGHQFGSFAGQLGDGAAIYLGEVAPPSSEAGGGGGEQRRWELQLKGAGLTPFSRTADGRKVLRSSLREFIASEYMAHAGVPTTRAATLVTSDSRVARDPVYSGEVVMERCSIVSRIAETFVRFGSFEICKPKDGATSRAGPSAGSPEVIMTLFTYVAEEFYADIANECKAEVAAARAAEAKVAKAAAISTAVAKASGDEPPAKSVSTNASSNKAWQEVASTRVLAEVCRRTAALVAKWQALGWVHGVLNTDNMSIVGLTIDYGPYGFMTHFDNDHVPNRSDHGGRYSYRQQPAMCGWNLRKLAEMWAIIFPSQKANFEAIIGEHFDAAFNEAYKSAMAAKLGIDYEALLAEAIQSDDTDADGSNKAALSAVEEAALGEERVRRASAVEDAVMGLIGELVFALQTTGAEMTNTFTILKKAAVVVDEGATEAAAVEAADESVAAAIAALCITPNARQKIIRRRVSELKPSMHPQQIEQLLQVARVDPDRLRDVFRGNVDPSEILLYLEEESKKAKASQQLQAEFAHWAGVAPEEKREKDAAKWKAFLKEYRKALASLGVSEATRRAVMAGANPVFVPFPWVLQDAIEKAEDGQYSLVRNLVDRCTKPFEEDPRDGVLWKMEPPPEAEDICVSCSS